ncbi:Domain of unknown function DUF2088 [Acididesulfobacillus acetoxydans]|uniref:Transcriptional regulator n=1 Tax=Acididesulfobacillus acetoxydans TaxID=1561005 RepID=A0A8S0XD25_9FIRM|nr:nickel-dependent lactate racemase [Acididesulfobacillus acetoxydans]CAA7603056.1 Domain of unknown function DUF2088 [Acididesulfobacillus acetoxydans]CEJ08708.1 Transcriptional regulator [Acididesulfobacillus acetoxydans]
MPTVRVPNGKGFVEVNLHSQNLGQIIEPKLVAADTSPQNIIEHALEHPVGTPRLSTIAAQKRPKKVVIVVTDITRPCPDDRFLPVILSELSGAGIENARITIVVATGMHRPCTRNELANKLGSDIVSKIEVVNHNPTDKENLVFAGKTSLNCPIYLNKLVYEADLRISTGIIEPHLFAGYSGARKAIAIGVAGEETIGWQHAIDVFDDPYTRIGNIDHNRFHMNASEIAEKVGLHFIVNGVLDTSGQLVRVVAGGAVAAFEAGVSFADKVYKVPIQEQADIVITGVSFPKDANLYQATRGASNVAFSPFPSVRQGGLIVLPATMPEGVGQGLGEQRFYNAFVSASNLDEVIKNIRSEGVPPGGHRAYLLARTLKHADLAIVGSTIPEEVRKMFMLHFDSMAEALDYGLARFGERSRVSVISHSLQVITVESTEK